MGVARGMHPEKFEIVDALCTHVDLSLLRPTCVHRATSEHLQSQNFLGACPRQLPYFKKGPHQNNVHNCMAFVHATGRLIGFIGYTTNTCHVHAVQETFTCMELKLKDAFNKTLMFPN